MGKTCYAVFLLGSASYLPGILVLAHTLRKYESRHPLIVLYNDSVPARALQVLQNCGIEVRRVEGLCPNVQITSIAERFTDTWTKMQVWGLTEYERIVLIDGDMMLRRNIDELFDLPLSPDWVACAHGCLCNLDKSWWAPESWSPAICGYTGLYHPLALTRPAKPTNPLPHEPYAINSGLVVLTPSAKMYKRILRLLSTTDPEEMAEVGSWLMPDQDFMGYLFANKWLSLPWVYNAIKISRFWHAAMWRDDYAANIHYICDKPWREPPSVTEDGQQLDVGEFGEPSDGKINGHGCNAVTHSWWWQEWFSLASDLSEDDLEYTKGFVVMPDPQTEAFLRRSPLPPQARTIDISGLERRQLEGAALSNPPMKINTHTTLRYTI